MFNRKTGKTSNSSGRDMGRFKGTWMPGAPQKGNGRKKKDLLSKRQRSWRLRKMSQNVSLLVSIPVIILLVGWLGYTLLLRSDIFRMTSISVQGNQVTSQQQILKAAGLNRGANLLTLDVSMIKESILNELWINKVWIKRHWPSTVEIIVQEYKPFALVNLERDGVRHLYYMSDKGVVFAPLSVERDLDYPVVNGSSLADDLQGKQFRKDSLGGMALDFLKLTARGNQILPTQAVSEISVDSENGLIVYLVDHPFPIYMGKEKLKLRFYRLVKVLGRLYKDDKIQGVGEIRMNYDENKILVARVDGTS